ncbi:AMP-binding protein [Rhodococcus sp. NBC_00294]|uniref:AMP-binding protein n=1 Tax=Rhodococcus sp. NBC_00294 TaxID=2976004 RepID=UPI002E2CEA5D|nr:AMP-binding protein [Rhodococcus sp. NBC_00294]
MSTTPHPAHASDAYSPTQIAGFKQQGLWQDRLLTDYLATHARERGSSTAVVAGSDRMTFFELADSVDRIAAGLVRLGLASGDFVAVQLPNIAEFVQVYLAIQRAGLRAVTLMPIYREQDVRFMLGRCQAKAFVTMSAYRGFDHVGMARSVRSALPSLEYIIEVGTTTGTDTIAFNDLKTADPLNEVDYDRVRPDPDGLSKVSFTSGTTGKPKGVVHTHNTDLVIPRLLVDATHMSADTPLWMPSPVSHVTGLVLGLYPALVAGAPFVLQDRWDPAAALELIARERAVLTVSATPFIAAMLDVPDRDKYDLTSFEYFLSGGARVSPGIVERARDELGITVLRVFGGAEAPLHAMNPTDADWSILTSRDGKTFSPLRSRIVDPADRSHELPRGDLGEYSTWGAHVFLGYLGDPERTRESRDEDGWFYSNDLCTIDDDGFVLYVDRTKDIINRGGIKISAAEVETELLTHPAVSDAAVIAVPDDTLGERAYAFVVTRNGDDLTLDDLRLHLEMRGVTTQKWPEFLQIVGNLPMTSTGKVLKTTLRETVAAAIP